TASIAFDVIFLIPFIKPCMMFFPISYKLMPAKKVLTFPQTLFIVFNTSFILLRTELTISMNLFVTVLTIVDITLLIVDLILFHAILSKFFIVSNDPLNTFLIPSHILLIAFLIFCHICSVLFFASLHCPVSNCKITNKAPTKMFLINSHNPEKYCLMPSQTVVIPLLIFCQ